jgi:hypothetical protein
LRTLDDLFEPRSTLSEMTYGAFPTGTRIHYVIYPASETRYPQQDDVVTGWPGVGRVSGYDAVSLESQDLTFTAKAGIGAGQDYKIAYCWYDGVNYSSVVVTEFTTPPYIFTFDAGAYSHTGATQDYTITVSGVPTLSSVQVYDITDTTARPRVTVTF